MKLFLILFVVLMVSVPRLIELLVPFHYFGFEQANEILITRQIVTEGKLPLVGSYALSENANIFRSPVWNYLMTIPFVFGNGNPYSFSIFMLSITSLLLVFSFFLIDKLFGRKVSLIFILLASFSPILVELSVKIWPPNLTPFLIPFYIYSLLKVYNKEKKYIFVLTFIFALIAHFEYPVAFRHGITLIPFVFYFLHKKILSKIDVFLSVLLFLFSFLPLIIFQLKSGLSSNFNIKELSSQIQIVHYLDHIIWNFRSTFVSNIFLSFAIFALMTFLSIFYFLKNNFNANEKLIAIYFLLLLFVTLVLTFVFKGAVPSWWIYDLPVFYILIFSILISKLLNKSTLKILAVIFLTLIISVQTKNIYKKFIDNNIERNFEDFIPNLKPIDHIYKLGYKDFDMRVYSIQSNTNDYEYLKWWRGNNKFEKNKLRDFSIYFVVIENDLPADKKRRALDIKSNEKLLDRKTLEKHILDTRSKN